MRSLSPRRIASTALRPSSTVLAASKDLLSVSSHVTPNAALRMMVLTAECLPGEFVEESGGEWI